MIGRTPSHTIYSPIVCGKFSLFFFFLARRFQSTLGSSSPLRRPVKAVFLLVDPAKDHYGLGRSGLDLDFLGLPREL